MTKKELRNRESRLRREASSKGLFIKKRKWHKNYSPYSYKSIDGYCIGIEKLGLILWGEDEVGMNAPTLEEAEAIVENY